MSQQGPLVQEDEDNGCEDNGHGGHQDHGEKIHKLHNCVLKSRVTTVTSKNKQRSSVGCIFDPHTLKVHKIENFFGFDFEFYTVSLLVMLKYEGFETKNF
jgi:hypothetical protein